MPILGIMASAISGNLGPVWDASDYESIATVTLSSTTSSISFSSITGTYKHLQIRGVSAGDQNVGVRCRFNSDTGSNYAWHEIAAGAGYGTGVYFYSGVSQTSIQLLDQQLGNSTNFNTSITDILDYASTNKNKTTRTLTGVKGGPGGFMYLVSGLWASTSAITSITLYPFTGSGFVANTTFALYGIKG